MQEVSMLLDLRMQKYICTLAETGNFREAAKKLYISQPNLSILIKKLEDTMGVQFFVRNQKHVELTKAGELLVAACKRMLEEEAGLEENLMQYKMGIQGNINVGSFLRLTPLFLPRVLPAFYALHPQVQVNVTESNLKNLMIGLQNNVLDLLVCSQPRRYSQYEYISLKKDYLMAALSPGNKAISHAKFLEGYAYPYLDMAYLAHDKFILQTKEQSIRGFVERALEDAGIRPEKNFVISNIETGVQLASENFGAAFCMESYIPTIHTTKPVSYFLTGNLENYAHICIVYKKERLKAPYVKEFIELVQEQMTK